ncbi:phosphodiester glycosidase family protein [Streptomyces sp. NPDC014006]|uniref:phosphodiester glycosidase family protein n=1 Tax=Streptomyces sp. NPDC014006 TaxID=3364870 RepID=UPI0036F69D33
MRPTLVRAVLRRRAVLPVAAGLLATALLPASVADADETTPSSLITSPGYTRGIDPVGPGLTLLTYDNPSDDRIVQVLRTDPDLAALTVESTTGTAGAMAEKTTDMLKSTTPFTSRWPHAGINGGFWWSTTGGLAFQGISVQKGRVQSASCAVPDRAEAVLIQHGRPYFSQFTTHLTVTAPGSTPMPLDGVNRHPGWMPGCSQGAGAAADRSIGEGLFTDSSEIVEFTPEYGAPTPAPDGDAGLTEDDDPGAEAVLDGSGRVVTLNPSGRGGTKVPTGGRVLQGIGTGADWLRAHAAAGTELTLQESVRDERFGDDIVLDTSVDIVNGHYPLVQDGEYAYAGSNVKVDPRTAVDGYGRTLFVAVTGKSTRNGVTLDELARILLDLGAVDGLNLDGGGSTTLVVEQTVRNRPSDATGERAVADSVYIGHGGYGLYAD